MSTPDDPFAFDPDKTVMRPMPGRRAAAPQRQPAIDPQDPTAPPQRTPEPRMFPQPDGAPAELPTFGDNTLVRAAGPLLTLAVRLRTVSPAHDVDTLRSNIAREMKQLDRRLEASGVQRQTAQTARYALCATIDDIVLNTPWGAQSGWSGQSLVSVFHNEVTGGDRFFDILRQLHAQPAGQIDLLELMYLCLSLGFEGRLRVLSNGPAEHARIRESLYATIRQHRGLIEPELSPRWQGIRAPHKPLTSQIPLWVFGLVASALLIVVFIGFSLALSGRSSAVFVEMGRLPPQGVVTVSGNTVTPPTVERAPRLRELLAPDIKAGVVDLAEDGRTLTISIVGTSFASGSANLERAYKETLKRVGAALQTEPGRIVVSGHTDSSPIRTVRFPSNYELSLARAEAAMAVVVRELTDGARVSAEGRADSEPLAPNDTSDGRAKNRRIEIALTKPFAG